MVCLTLGHLYVILSLASVYINNHTSVWGSWYIPSNQQWGYACCHSIIHMSYCAGAAGIEAQAASTAQKLLASGPGSEAKGKRDQAEPPIKSLGENKVSKALASSKDSKRKDRTGPDDEEDGSKRRKFNAGVTDDEMGW